MPLLHPTAEELFQALARSDVEAVQGSFPTGRYRCRYLTWGTSHRPPVVFIHGMADQARSFAMVMAHLVDAGFRCVGYELPNSLDDTANLGMIRHADLAEDLVALLDHLKVPVADLVGSSFGTTISLRALTRHPNRFRRVVLKGGFARRPLLRIERGLSRLARYWPWRMAELPFREFVMRRLEGGQFVGCPAEVYEFLLWCSGVAPCRAAARRTLIIDKLDLRPILHQVHHPVLLIGGDRDVIVHRSCEADLETGLPNVRRIEFSPCGHYPQYTLPGPTADAIRDFFASPS